ncbi:MAG TPA: ABC transporter permease [Candidatus Acidoferrum sp.]
MTNLVTLTRVRMMLALRNKMFFFFSVIMPLGFFFLYAGVFAKGRPDTVRYFLGPILALNVMGSFWGLSATLVTFREQGILRRFHVAPVTASDMLASSVLANFVLTLPTVIVILGLARFVYHVHDFGNILAAFLFICVGTVSFGSLGLVVASITNTMQETQVLNQLLWLPLIFLSGATVPLPDLPKVVQGVAVFLPATFLVTGIQQATYFSKSSLDLIVYILALAFWAVLSFFVSSQLFRWEPETKIPRNAKLWALATIIPFVLLGFWEHGKGSMVAEAQAAYKAVNQRANDPAQEVPKN